MILLIMNILIFCGLFFTQISLLVKSIKTSDNANWLTLFSSIGGSILSVVLFFLYGFYNEGAWEWDLFFIAMFCLFVEIVICFIVLLIGIAFKIREKVKFKKEKISRNKIEKKLVKKFLAIPFLIIVLISVGGISIDFFICKIEVYLDRGIKQEELRKMADFVNEKYGMDFKENDCIYYRKEDYSRHEDILGNGKNYNIPYLGIFEKGKNRITVADRNGKLSDDGQLEELNGYIGNYFSKITGEKIDFVQVRKTGNGNTSDDTINFVLQEKFGYKIIEENIDDFMEIVLKQEDLELLFYIKASDNMEKLLHNVTNKLNYLEKYMNIERLMIYFYDKEEELFIKKIQKIEDYGDYEYTAAVTDEDYYDDYKFDYYYVPNECEYYDSESNCEKFNTFVASAFCVLDRGYSAAQGKYGKFEKIINNWEVYKY